MKSCPNAAILKLFESMGLHFDCSSVHEVCFLACLYTCVPLFGSTGLIHVVHVWPKEALPQLAEEYLSPPHIIEENMFSPAHHWQNHYRIDLCMCACT
jgi:hypothetical protein